MIISDLSEEEAMKIAIAMSLGQEDADEEEDEEDLVDLDLDWSALSQIVTNCHLFFYIFCQTPTEFEQ